MAMKQFSFVTKPVIFSALLLGLNTHSSAQTVTTFTYTGTVQTYTVPVGVTSLQVDMQGAKGGFNSEFPSGSTPSDGGNGGRVQATLAVTPGEVLNIYVGGAGGAGITTTGGAGGFNGGGAGSDGFGSYGGGGGGGASDIRVGDNALSSRVIVAGGGGGAGNDYFGFNQDKGGDGGGVIAQDGLGGGVDGANGAGFAGTQVAGGTGGTYSGYDNGADGSLGIGGDGDAGGGNPSAGGGGGGGYYGGGGGSWGGAGGGSSYTDPVLATAVTHTQGYNSTGDGVVLITVSNSAPHFTAGRTQSLSVCQDSGPNGFNTALTISDADTAQTEVWSLLTAPTNGTVAGLPDTMTSNGSFLTPTGIPTSITYAPGAGYSGMDTFTVLINDNAGGTDTTTIVVTVNPTPTVNSVSGQAVCNGDTTSTISFSGTPAGVTYSWTNSDGSIGLATTGTGNIMSFTVTNTTTAAVVSTITVTPSANGCTGTPQNFTITANPTPSLTTPLDPVSICDSTLFNYGPSSGVTGTSFAWSRAAVTGISNPATTGADTVNEVLVNTTSMQVPVAYTYTLTTSAGCSNVQTVTDTVNPRPMLDSALSRGSICDSTLFSFMATSSTSGVSSITWTRDTIPGIIPGATFGAGNVSETLQNTTNAPILVTYVYTLLANSCLNTQSVTVTVNPKPTLSSSLTPASICDSTMFTYVPTSGITGTTVLYSWMRDTIAGISNSPASGTDTVNEVLINTTANPIPVTYTYTLTAYGCSNSEDVNVTVNPRPTLTTTTTPPAICDSTVFLYVPASGSTGTTFAWSRPSVAGISNPAAHGVDTIRERLNNTTVNPITVFYYDTLRVNGCVNIQQISLTVNPKPHLSSSLTPPSICNNGIFDYPPTSNTSGAAFSWVRPFVSGISNLPGSGAGTNANPNEQLNNTTNVDVIVKYQFTLTIAGCSNVDTVKVKVHPTPLLATATTASACSNAPFTYKAISLYPDSSILTYKWSRASVTGITPSTGSGTSATISETLTNSQGTPTPVTYIYTLTITDGNCKNTQNLRVTVNPAPAAAAIGLMPPATLCSNTMYQNFGAVDAPSGGVHYSWTATNAQVWATGATGQYALVNFNTPGPAVVTLNTAAPGTDCASPATYSVTVTASVSDNPQVIYYRGQLICLTNNEDSYQWGYDDAITLAPTSISGEVSATYFVNGLDLEHRYYWVMTKSGDCEQKTYYNVPMGVTNVNAGKELLLNVYPNPASSLVNVELNEMVGGNVEVEILNMVGQKISSTMMQGRKTQIDVSALPAGGYFVDCLRDGVKIGAAKFIKN